MIRSTFLLRMSKLLLIVLAVGVFSNLNAQSIKKLDVSEVQGLPLIQESNLYSSPTQESKIISKKTATKQLNLPTGLEINEIKRLPATNKLDKGDLSIQFDTEKGSTLEKDFSDLTLVEDTYAAPQGFNVLVILEAADSTVFRCSGSLIDPQVVLLTGGCLYDADNYGGFIEKVTVLPSFDGRFIGAFRDAESDSLFTTSGWIENGDLEQNLGYVQLDRPIGATVGWWLAEEDGDPERFDYSVLADDDFIFVPFTNESYPFGEGFEPFRMYARDGSFDNVSSNLVSHNSTSFAGQQGSSIYFINDDGAPTVGGVLSHLNNDGSTAYVRITEEKAAMIDNTIAEITPDQPDLVPLPVPLFSNFINQQQDPGTILDTLIIGVTNYSEADFQGDILWAIVLSTDREISGDDIIVGGLQVSDFPLGAKQSAFFNGAGILEVPADIPEGEYFIASFLDVEDANLVNDFPLASDFTPIIIGDNSPSLTVNPESFAVSFEAGTETLDIIANVDWEASLDADWLTLSSTSGSGSTSISIEYEENPNMTSSRSANITITPVNGEVDPVIVSFTQRRPANFLFVSPDTIQLSAAAGSTDININSDLLWSVRESIDWLSLSRNSGFGGTTIQLNYDENTTEDARIETVTFNSISGASDDLVVIQSGTRTVPATVVDIIVDSEIHNTLEAAVIAAELADDLSGEGPFTVFAPTDDAFAALPEGTVEALLEDPTGDLANILLYHVLGSKVLSTDLSDGLTATTLLGEDVTVTINDAGVFINNAQVIVADLEAENGVVHVIDAVLLPPTCEDKVNGGTVAIDGSDAAEVTIVIDDAPDAFQFVSNDAFGDNFLFVVTDDNNVILATSEDGAIDFNGAGPGICRVWGLSYTGNLTAMGGDNAAEVALSDDCFDLSDNFITVIREEQTCEDKVNGGTVAIEGSDMMEVTIVVDEEADAIQFVSNGAFGESFLFVITDDSNVILGTSEDGLIDFNEAGPGICRVWGLSFTGNLTGMKGDNAAEVALSDDCFDLSDNFITVIRAEQTCEDKVNGGTVAIDGSDATEVTIVIDDAPDAFQFVSNDAFGDNFLFVVTDDSNVILATSEDGAIDFNGAGPGICRVWGLSYTGNLTAMGGDNAAEVALSDDCFDLSDNFITVIREEPIDPNSFLEIKPASKTVEASADKTIFVIDTNSDWEITTDADWIQIFPPSGSGVGFITLVYTANESTEARTAVLDITTSAGLTGTFSLIQAAAGANLGGANAKIGAASIVGDLALYPNPTSDQLTLDITSAVDVEVELGILNAKGQLVKYINHQTLVAGNNNVQIDVTDLNTGTYYLTIVGEQFVQETTFSVQK